MYVDVAFLVVVISKVEGIVVISMVEGDAAECWCGGKVKE